MNKSCFCSCPQQEVEEAESKKINSRIGHHDGKNMLQLLCDCSGAFRPGILTALVRSSLSSTLFARVLSLSLHRCKAHIDGLLIANVPPTSNAGRLLWCWQDHAHGCAGGPQD